jgi:hypothetical protein
MSEQSHQRLQRDAGVDQGGGVGVAQLVRGDVVDPGGHGGPVELGADRVLGQSPAVVGEQELGGSPVARVRHRASGAADLGDVVDQREDLGVERDHPLGVELAERDLQPAAVTG